MSLPESTFRDRGFHLAFLLCVFHFTSFDITRQAILTDIRYFVYFAGQVAKGAVPHLDYFENKTQLATYAGALLHGLGELLGLEPFMMIRAGYLFIAALGGLATYFIFRRLGAGSAVAGGLGLLAHCSFGLLGVLPSIGNVPKLLMAVGASAAALLCYRRSWFLAGAVGSLAFMDWQIGGLVGLAVLVTAGLHARRRARALPLTVAGGAAGLVPFVVYYAINGALVETVRQVIGATFFRGQVVLAGGGLGDRLANIARVANLACPGQAWLFYLGLAGLPVMFWYCWRWRRDDRARLLHPLAIYHLGVVAFTLTDFQYYGDFFLLLHSVAFFLGALWLLLHERLASAVGESRQAVLVPVLLALAFLAARPGFTRPRIELVTKQADPAVTLQDQREVAAALEVRLGEGSIAMLESSELLILMKRDNALPLVYCNLPAWYRNRRDESEGWPETCTRLLLEPQADALVPPESVSYDSLARFGYSLERLESTSGRYAVTVAFR